MAWYGWYGWYGIYLKSISLLLKNRHHHQQQQQHWKTRDNKSHVRLFNVFVIESHMQSP